MEIKIPRITKQQNIMITNEEAYKNVKNSYTKLLVRCSLIAAILFALSTLGGIITFFIRMEGNLWWVATGCSTFVMLALGKLIKNKLYGKGLYITNCIITGLLAIFYFVGSIVVLVMAADGIFSISFETHIIYAIGFISAIAPFLSCMISIIWLCCKLNRTWREQIELRTKPKEPKAKKKSSKKLTNKKTKLEELKTMYDEKLITEKEYNAARKKIIEKE